MHLFVDPDAPFRRSICTFLPGGSDAEWPLSGVAIAWPSSRSERGVQQALITVSKGLNTGATEARKQAADDAWDRCRVVQGARAVSLRETAASRSANEKRRRSRYRGVPKPRR